MKPYECLDFSNREQFLFLDLKEQNPSFLQAVTVPATSRLLNAPHLQPVNKIWNRGSRRSEFTEATAHFQAFNKDQNGRIWKTEVWNKDG